MLLTYPEFNKIAIKEEFVFQYTVEEQSILIIPYEGTFIIWLPDDNEPSETYTKFEKIEIQTGYATFDSVNTFWEVTLVVKNSGSEVSTVNRAFLNDVPCSNQNYGIIQVPPDDWGVSFSNAGFLLSPGHQDEIHLLIDNGYLSLSSGTTINVKLHSTGGMDYIKLIRLP